MSAVLDIKSKHAKMMGIYSQLKQRSKYRPRTWESHELQDTRLSCPSPSPGVCSGKGLETAVLFFWPEKWEGPDYRNLSTRLHSLDAHLRKAFRSFSLHNFWVSLVAQKVRICLQCRLGSTGLGRAPGGGQPTLVFLPRESHGQRSLAGYYPWGHKKADKTE